MKQVLVPVTDVNSESVVITSWFADDRGFVRADDVIAEVETSKAILEVQAPADGYVLHAAPVGAQVALSRPLALVFDDLVALETHAAGIAAAEAAASSNGVAASEPARRRAAELGIDIHALRVDGLITVKHVEQAAASRPDSELPEPLTAPPGMERVLLIGAGQGANQVMEIFAAGGRQTAVGIIDDDTARWGADVDGTPVVGGTARLEELFAAGTFDAALVAISTSVAARRKFREHCDRLGIPLTNAIDPTARISRDVELGRGNVICAFCHLGTATRVADNNFLSAYNSFDHHNVLGSDISTGPGCMTSGDVTLGDGVRLGAGIFVEPHVRLGDGVRVASGAVIVASVADGHTVKTKLVTTAVVGPRVGVG